ncbi:MAG TPA: succinate dehydrogenase, hydrophobic membrane anchor protein [Burkholderiaceae bacterium]|jgi:succinate dehydrogenase / fumarate reductase membrane anchor subunit|nr:succinate dehydrogenase, hydrophobic membrane anchor protein [Burkholderiaceae bacterium]
MSIGVHRLVVGAHYGLRDWLMQRATAVVLTLYLIVLGVRILLAGPIDYDSWAAIFVPLGMKIATLIAFVALTWHAWIGMRDIWMDYVRSTAIRMLLQLGTVLWLAACLVWAVQILWKV